MSKIEKIGRYVIESNIGSGMQGTVYRARDPELDRQVAIKLLRTDDSATASRRSPLEARIAGKLHHPNIVPIFDVGRYESYEYLVFELVEGQTLRQLLGTHGSFSIEQVLGFAVPIVDAIAHAHSQGILHLDLSPRNILIDKDQNPRIMDFGLSQFAHEFVNFGDQIKGSPLYMAPEHFSTDALGSYTDIYALGASFYQLATGEPVFRAASLEEAVHKICKASPDLSLLPAGPLTPDFAAVLKACMVKDYHRRLHDGSALRDALLRMVSRHTVSGLSQQPQIHCTVQFLLHRMQRKQDFPTISRILSDINRLTGDEQSTSAEKLANVILRDYSLTNKLLKLVNSAYFGSGGDVTSVSRAIILLGVEQVRSTANSLAYFGQMTEGQSTGLLRSAMLRSFLSALLARHLAQRTERGSAEEAFICGLFRNLGENLTIYYFPDDYDEIVQISASTGCDRITASERVLGISFRELGAEVARVWGLPEIIIDAIGEQDTVAPAEPVSGEQIMRYCAVFANELCALAELDDAEARREALDALIARFGSPLAITEPYVCRLIAAGLDKLAENAAILEVDHASNAFCHAMREWLDELQAPDSAPRGQVSRALSHQPAAESRREKAG